MQVSNEKTMIALNVASTEVATAVESMIAEVAKIEDEYKSIVPVAEEKSDYNFCKEVRKNVLPIKTRMEEARKALKAPVIEMGKLIDSSLNPLKDRLDAVYKPFEDAYREVDNRKKVAEEARQEIINSAFNRMNDSAMEAIGQTSSIIESIIEDLQDFDFDPGVFMERTDEAVRKHKELMIKLQSMLAAQITQEETEAKLEKLAELEAKEKQEQEKAAQAKRDEGIRAQAQKDAEARHAQQLEQAKVSAENAARQAEIDKAAAIEKAKSDQIAEQTRLREIEEEKQRKLEANKKHVGKIRGEAKDCLIEQGLSEEQAKDVVLAISKGLITNVTINY